MPGIASSGMRAHDLPDLTIKEVKVYHINGSQNVAGVVTNSGIEGNYA